MDRKPLGKRIRAARKAAGLTGDALSERCHVNASYLRQIESGSKSPSLPLLISLCNALGVSPSHLLADYLSADEGSEMKNLCSLYEQAGPAQRKMIATMAKSIVESMAE